MIHQLKAIDYSLTYIIDVTLQYVNLITKKLSMRVISPFVVIVCSNFSIFCWFCLMLLSLFLQPPSCLVVKAPSIASSCLMTLLCSCACKACKSSAREIFYRSFMLSRVVMVTSNFSGTVTSSFSTILESFNTDPSNLNLTLLAMLRSLSRYGF